MAPSGPHQDGARAAPRREPIILRGFDRKRQLDINFNTFHFSAAWLRRTYTNETHPHITVRTRNDEVCPQEVKYGNNITVLLKACFQLRHYYASRGYWPAIAQGFGASAEVVREMVELLVEARSRYRKDNPGEVDIARSGANVAADRWLSFLDNRKSDGGTRWSDDRPVTPSFELHRHAREFFSEAEGKQVDLGNVLPKETDHRSFSHYDSRKRFASPEPPGQPPSPKRRSSASRFDRTERLPLTPLSTGHPINVSARQDYQTSMNATDRPDFVQSPAQGSADEDAGILRKVRGLATKNSVRFPAIDSPDSKPNHALANGSSDVGNQQMRDKVARLEQELSNVKSRLSNNQAHRIFVNKILSDHGLIGVRGPSTTGDRTIESMQTRLASLEKKLADEAARHAQGLKDVKESVRIAKDENSSLSDNTVKKSQLVSNQDQDVTSTLRALEHVQGRIASLEDKLRVHGTTETQMEIASLESTIANLQSPPAHREPSVPGGQKMIDDPIGLEKQVIEIGAKEHSQVNSHDMWDKLSRLEDRVDSISKRVATIETKPDEGEYVRELESKVAVIELQQNREKESHATKTSIETAFELLDSRLAREKDAASKELQVLRQRLTATEMQNSRLLETVVDMPKTLNSPHPPQDMQRNLDEAFKRINSLPTEKHIIEMILKREQISKSENEKLWLTVENMSTRISSLPTATSISDMVVQRDQNSKADTENLRRRLNDLSTSMNNLPDVAYVSEKLFHLEQKLRTELERQQQATDHFVDGNKKNLETLQLQMKGLNKLWNEATARAAESDTLRAVKVEVDGLKGAIATQSKMIDTSKQGFDTALEDTMKTVHRQLTDLSTQVHTILSTITPENLLKRLQEVRSGIEACSVTKDARVDGLVLEMDTLHTRVSTLARALYDVSQFVQFA